MQTIMVVNGIHVLDTYVGTVCNGCTYYVVYTLLVLTVVNITLPINMVNLLAMYLLYLRVKVYYLA